VDPKNLEEFNQPVSVSLHAALPWREISFQRAPRTSRERAAVMLKNSRSMPLTLLFCRSRCTNAPLSERAMAVLRERAQLGTEGFAVPALKAASAPSNVVPSKAVHVCRRHWWDAARIPCDIPQLGRRVYEFSLPNGPSPAERSG
jgi:hypothetical protein